MRALVTGSEGFIAGHLMGALLDRGDEVVALDALWGQDLRELEPDQRWGDLDVIFHTAAISRTPHAIHDPVGTWETNLGGSVRLLEAARRSNVPRVVLSSSNIVYAAETPYRASKLAMEAAAKVYSELYGLSTICLRYANTYGSGQSEDGIGPNVFASLRKTLREEGHVRISGDGEQTRDFIHVSDVVRANLLAAQSDVQGEFDICTGRNVSMNDIAKLIDAPVVYTDEREGDIRHIVQDSLPAFQALGFKPTVPLEEGIADSFPHLAVPA